jgi:hypothetical protein
MSRLIHPRLMQTLERDFFAQQCTIREPVKSRNAIGGETRDYQDLPGHNGLACHVDPAQGGERRTEQQVYLEATHVIMLNAPYPGISEEMQAVVEGVAYDILLATLDSQRVLTELVVRLVR